MKHLLLTTALIAVGAASTVNAQSDDAAAQDAGSDSPFMTAPMDGQLRASSVIGQRLFAASGSGKLMETDGALDEWENIGEISDVIMSREGQIEAVLVDIGDFTGEAGHQIAARVSDVQFISDGSTETPDDFFLVLNTDPASLKDAPAYSAEGGEAAQGDAEDVAATEQGSEPADDGKEEVAASEDGGGQAESNGEDVAAAEDGAEASDAGQEDVAASEDNAEKAEADGQDVAAADDAADASEDGAEDTAAAEEGGEQAEANGEDVAAAEDAEASEEGNEDVAASDEAGEQAETAGEDVAAADEGAEAAEDGTEDVAAAEEGGAEAEGEDVAATEDGDEASGDANEDMAAAENDAQASDEGGEDVAAEDDAAASEDGNQDVAAADQESAQSEGTGEDVAAAEDSTENTADAHNTAENADAEDVAAAPADAREGTDAQPADEETASAEGDTAEANENAAYMTVENLDGARVYDSNDKWVGEISEVLVTEDGQITDAIVDVGGFLGIGEKSVAVKLADLKIQREDGSDDVRIYTAMAKDDLMALSEFVKR